MKFTVRLLIAGVLFAALLSPAARGAERSALSLRIAWNNPFNPSRGEITKIQYVVRATDSPVRLSVHAADGHVVRQLGDRVAQADVVYEDPWDGRNDDGNLVDSGLYFVVLRADAARKVARVVVKRE